MVTHPHPNPPLEGEGIFSLLHLQGGGREGDGVKKRNAMLKCDKVELNTHEFDTDLAGSGPVEFAQENPLPGSQHQSAVVNNDLNTASHK